MPVESVYVPHLDRTFKLGRIRPKAPPQVLRFKNYLTGAPTTPPPAKVDYYTKAGVSLKRVYLNDEYGDCVIAGKYHQIGLWSANDNSPEVLASDDEVLRSYHTICGPGDNGCNITDVLDYFKNRGLVAGGNVHKIDGYVAVDNSNRLEVCISGYLFGSHTLGMNLPRAWADNAKPGFIWEPTYSGSVGGHDICTVGYDDVGVQVATWGMVGTITWDAFADRNIIDECYVELSPDWYGSDKLAPCGVDADKLAADLKLLGSGTIPPLDPPSPPAPIPVPVPPPGGWLAQIEAFIKWLLSLIHPTNVSGTAGKVFSDRGITPGMIGPIIAVIMADIVKVMPVILADLKAGKSYVQILEDVLAVLFANPPTK